MMSDATLLALSADRVSDILKWILLVGAIVAFGLLGGQQCSPIATHRRCLTVSAALHPKGRPTTRG
jgi:hypothetical protein